MSNHPTIAALRAALESERLNEQKQWANATFPPLNIETTKDFTQDVNFARREVHALAYKAGHEAATERLMEIIEKAVEMATDIERGFEFDGDGTEWQVDKDDMRYLAREFLTTLADASGENSKPGHYIIDAESFDKLIEDLDKEPSEAIKKAREKFLRLNKEKLK